MAINFPCPICRRLNSAEDDCGGIQIHCPHCRQLVLIPKRSPLSETAEISPETVYAAIAISVAPYRKQLEERKEKLRESKGYIQKLFEESQRHEESAVRLQQELWSARAESQKSGTPLIPAEDMASLNDDLERLERTASERLKQVTELQRECDALRANPSMPVDANETVAELERLRAEREQYAGAREELRAEVARLGAELERARSAEALYQEREQALQAQADGLQKQLRVVEQELQEARWWAEDSVEEQGSQQDAMQRLKAEIDGLREERSLLQRERESLLVEHRADEDIKEAGEERILELQRSLEARQDNVLLIESELAEVRQWAEELVAEKAHDRERIRALQEASGKLLDRISDLESDLAGYRAGGMLDDAPESGGTNLDAKIASLELHIRQMARDNNRLENTVNSLSQNLKAAMGKTGEPGS